MFTVYCLTLADGWLYVGQTKELHKRLCKHRRPWGGSRPNATDLYIRAHGGPVDVAILGEMETVDGAKALEERAVTNLRTCGYLVVAHAWAQLPVDEEVTA